MTGRPKKLKIEMFFIPNLAREVDGSSNLEKLFQPEFRYLKQPASPIAHATLSFQKYFGFPLLIIKHYLTKCSMHCALSHLVSKGFRIK